MQDAYKDYNTAIGIGIYPYKTAKALYPHVLSSLRHRIVTGDQEIPFTYMHRQSQGDE